MISVGNKKITNLKIGNKTINKMYHGSNLIYGGEQPTPPTPPATVLDGGEWGKIYYSIATNETTLSDEVLVKELTQEEWEKSRDIDRANGCTILFGTWDDGRGLVMSTGGNEGHGNTRKYSVPNERTVYGYARAVALGSKCTVGYKDQDYSSNYGYGSKWFYPYWEGPYRSKDIQIVFPEGITELEEGVFALSWVINPITLPPNLTKIGHKFMAGASQFNNDIVFPSTVTYAGNQFMANMNNMTSTVYANFPASAFEADWDAYSWYSFAINSNTAACFTQGIKIAGPYAEEWMAKFPNTGPEGGDGRYVPAGYYRNLVLVTE